MKPLDFKLILTMVFSTMLSLNLSSHSGKTKLVSTSVQPIFSPIEDADSIDENAGVLGNLVWEDMNGDGIQNLGEPGLAKVIVKLFDASHTLQDIKMTNQKGFFRFNNLEAGDYQIEFEKPDGYDFTFCSLNTSGDSDSNVAYNNTNEVRTTGLIHINKGEKNLSIDAGMFRCIPIGDMVWFDLNRNNIKDFEESGINGLSVQIFRKDDNEWSKWDEVFTGNTSDAAADEGYFKACVPPGEYYLEFDMPAESFANVEPYAGDPLADSDITGANGMNTTDSFIVSSGEEKMDLGAGYFSLETEAQAKLVTQIEIEDPSNSMMDMMIEVYDKDNNLVASAKRSERDKLNMEAFEAEGYYVKIVPVALKRIPAYYAKPASLREKN